MNGVGSVFFFPQPYTNISTYEVYIHQPRKFPYFIGNNFVRWRNFIEHLAPFRVNSIVVRDPNTDAKVLRFLIEGNTTVQEFVRLVRKHFDDKCTIKIKPQVLSPHVL